MKKSKATRTERLVIYTVLIGDKEELNDPLRLIGGAAASDLAIDFICMTDDLKRTSPTWRMMPLKHGLLPKEKLSRLPKARPDLFFPKYERSLYIDNTVVFKRLPCKADCGKSAFRGFRHPWRTHPLDEADVVAKSGLDVASTIVEQLRFYMQNGFLDAVSTLTAGTVLLRRHNDFSVKEFGRLWWEQILVFSKRDQLSLDLCAQVAGCPVDHFPGDKRDNDLFFWPALPTGRRVLGSFDSEMYAWLHRQDAEATNSPRAHFLASEEESSERYQRKVAWFDYLCNRVGSGLGTMTAPRRGVAEVLDLYLPGLEGRRSKILLVGVSGADSYATEVTELASARTALERYFRFSTQPELVAVLQPVAELDKPAPFRAAQGISGFDIVLVTGLPARYHPHSLSKFLPLLGPSGRLVVEFGESLTVAAINEMWLNSGGGGSLEIFSGRFIDKAGPIPSSIFVFSKSPAG